MDQWTRATPVWPDAVVVELENAVFRACPAIETEVAGGWTLRAAGGVTGRGNSVYTAGDADPLASGIEEAEAFYRSRGLAPRFQISPVSRPPGLDDLLERRGYRRVSDSLVQSVDLSTLMERTTPLGRVTHCMVELGEALDDEWFDLYIEAERVAPRDQGYRRQILERIEQPVGFVRLLMDGGPAAVGLGVVDGTWVGVYNLATLDRFRRRGAASAILRTLAIWGGLLDAARIYLLVKAANEPALALYARCGFTTLYPYHYRLLDGERPDAH